MDKIAFFGLFLAVLLAAYLIVLWRSAIVLSEPIELKCASLSVCIPTGNNWQSEKQWKYHQNAFTLESIKPGSVTTMVSCQYLLAPMKATPNELFEEKAYAVGGLNIAETGRIEVGGQGITLTNGSQNGGILTLNWAHIKSLAGGSQRRRKLSDVFFGVVQLPNNRRLDIEVYQTEGGTGLAESIFRSITESLKFTDSQLLEDGSQVIAAIKSRGLGSFLDSAGSERGWDRESFFLIKDGKGHSVGFAVEALDCHFSERRRSSVDIEQRIESQFNILAWSFYYIHGRYDREQTAFFKSNNSFDEFLWRSETSGPGGRSSAEIFLGEGGIMTVKEFDRRSERGDYQVGPAAVPEIFSELVFSQMLDTGREEIFVDIIDVDGKITPVFITRVEESRSFASRNLNGDVDIDGKENAYVFREELLDGRGFYEQVYLDEQRRITKRLLQQESEYFLERTTMENVLKEFPEHGGYILQGKDERLGKNRM